MAPAKEPLTAKGRGRSPGQEQELLEFGAKELGPRRIVEGQRREGLKHLEAAGVAPVFGFHADDGDDDLLGNAVSRPARARVAWFSSRSGRRRRCGGR